MSPDIPTPREAVAREASNGGDHAELWRGAYYGFMAALAKNRGYQAIEALQTVVTGPETR